MGAPQLRLDRLDQIKHDYEKEGFTFSKIMRKYRVSRDTVPGLLLEAGARLRPTPDRNTRALNRRKLVIAKCRVLLAYCMTISPADIARKIGSKPELIHILMKELCEEGVLRRTEPGRYALPRSQQTLSTQSNYVTSIPLPSLARLMAGK